MPPSGASFPMFRGVSVNVPPSGPPSARTASTVRVERRSAHAPGAVSWRSSKTTAFAEKETETPPVDGTSGGRPGPRARRMGGESMRQL